MIEDEMQTALKGILSFFKKSSPPRKRTARKSFGQSLVEVAIALPLLLMLFSGMVEFGFMLNTYLSLLDATRQTARLYSNVNPFLSIDDTTTPPTMVEDPNFYEDAAEMVKVILEVPDDPYARKVVFDPSQDDVLVSVLRVKVSSSTNTITGIERYPALDSPYRLYDNHPSAYADDARVASLMTQNGTTPVRAGLLIIEVYYGYEGVLKLPWVEIFMDTITLHASSIMPIVSAKPPISP
jgi:hypothetical protein